MNVGHSVRIRSLIESSSTALRSPSSDYFTHTLSSTIRARSPEAQLLDRWQDIGNSIASIRMSCDAVITLNRYLDTVEDVLFNKFPVVEDTAAQVDDLEFGISKKAISGPAATFVDEPMSSILVAPKNISDVGFERRLSQDDEGLLARVTNAVERLRERQKEFKHLHDIVIQSSSRATEKIHQMKLQMNQMEKDAADDETDLTYLKLQLRIIEIQTLPYVPQKDHDSLAKGIQRWKLDWANVNNRFRKRKWKREVEKQA